MRLASLFFVALVTAAPALAGDEHFEIPDWVKPKQSRKPSSPPSSGHFEIPNWVKPQGMPGNAGGYQVNDMNPPPSCGNKADMEAWLRNWRQKARNGFADLVAKHMPSLDGRATCINAREARDARYVKEGDYWVISCLAQTRGELTHLFKMELMVEPAECLSNASIAKFVNSSECQRPGEAQRFVQLALSPCPISRLPPRLRSGNVVYPMSLDFLNALKGNRPSIGNIVDNDRKVKREYSNGGGSSSGSAGSASSGSGSDKDCTSLACFPKVKPAN